MVDNEEEYEIKDGFFYSKDHEWVKRQSGEDLVVVGVTDYAAKMLHDIVYVNLPRVGTSLKKKDTLGQIESVKTVADVYMPISGSVVDVNSELTSRPETISQSPYEGGWLVKVKASSLDEDLNALLDAKAYSDYIISIHESEK